MKWLCALVILGALLVLAACAEPSAPIATLPSPTPTLAPDYQATVDVAVRGTVAAILTLTPPPTPRPRARDGLVAEVVRVIDGDTIDVVLEDGSTGRVRLLGIDTPETYGQNKAYEYGSITDTDCLDNWGIVATGVAIDVLEGRTVTLVLDPLAGERRSFGRLLAYVHVGGEDFNAALVKLGYARVYAEGDSSR